MKKILVLLSYYNGHKYIEEQLDSIFAQKDVSVVVAVRDDGSSNRNDFIFLNELRNKYNNLLIIEGDNLGCARSFRALLEIAQRQRDDEYDYFAFADQDDFWLEDKLSNAVKRLDSIEAVGPKLYCSNLLLADCDLSVIGKMNPDKTSVSSTPVMALVENIATGCTMVFNKELVNLYLEKYIDSVRLHDSWMYLICRYFGTVYYDTNAYILYRQHGANVEGYATDTFALIKRKWKSLRSDNSYRAYNSARDFLDCFSYRLDEESIKELNLIANYPHNINGKYNLIMNVENLGIKRDTFIKNIVLYYRILSNNL